MQEPDSREWVLAAAVVLRDVAAELEASPDDPRVVAEGGRRIANAAQLLQLAEDERAGVVRGRCRL